MKNILVLARANVNELELLHDKVRTAKTDSFEQFLKKNKEFSITTLRGIINNDVAWNELSKVPTASRILQSGKYMSQWEVDPDNAEKHFSKRANERCVFDSSFVNGKKFKYLAVTAGTIGLPHWGDVTLVFNENKFNDDEFIILYCNSLSKNKTMNGFYYFNDEADELNFEQLEKHLATKDDLEKLGVIKLFKDLESCKVEDFKFLLLRPLKGNHKDYLEVITWKDINLSECLDEIRMTKSHYRIINDAVRNAIKDPDENINANCLKNLIEFNKLISNYTSEKKVKLDLIDE